MNLLLFLSLFPIIIIGFIIYKNDRVEKESKPILIKVFCGGILSVLITLLLSSFLEMGLPFFRADNEINLNFITAIPYYYIGVALIEEFSKWIFVYLFCWKDNEFNYLYDSIIYCVFAALGFATLENILYVFASGVGIGIVRSLFAVPGHAFFAVFMGYYLGMSKLAALNGNKKRRNKYFILSIVIPMLLHGTYDYLLSISDVLNPISCFILFLVFIICLYIFAIRLVRKTSRINICIYNN